MLKLPAVTLLAIDCVNPRRTATTMFRARRLVEFGELVMVTDTNRHRDLPGGFRYVHRVQGDTMAEGMGVKVPMDYERDVLCFTHTVVRTPFVLHIEWDAMLANPRAWKPSWLDWDYIGAPWPGPLDQKYSWPGHHSLNLVGNGGFALKSRRFCKAISELIDKNLKASMSSDCYQCRTLRPLLEAQGMRFAPYEVAEDFACENRIYSGQFGLHGKGTIALNGFNVAAPI